MKKGSKVYIIITIIFFLAMVLYAAYASLTINAEVTTNNLNITSNTYSPMVFTSVGGNSLTVNISAENMDSSNAGNYIATMSDNLTVRLDTDGKDAMCCTYNVSWEWVEDNNTLNQYTKSNTESNEFTLTGTTSGTAGSYNFTNQLPNYDGQNRTTSMLSGAQICNKNSGVTAATVSQVWTFTTNFYNLNVNQDAFKGASLNGKVKITDVSCNKGESISFNIGGTSYKATQNMTWQEWVNSSNNTQGYKVKDNKVYTANETKYIDVSPTATINISGSYSLVSAINYLGDNITSKSNQTSSQDSSTWAIVNEGNGLRYEGKNPDNYVCFSSNCTDDTLYRIIGKFTEMVDTDNDGTADTNQSVVKIIKNTSVGNYLWDEDTSPYAYVDNQETPKVKFINNKIYGDIAAPDNTTSGQSNWAQASLKNYLNNNWTKPTSSLLTTRWYLKAPSSYTTATASDWLTGERNGTKYSGNPEYWDGKVGLVYPSDYGYGVLASNCSRTKYLYYNSNSSLTYISSGCYNQDWLYLGSYEWTISPLFDRDNETFYISYNGLASYTYVVDGYYAVRPSFYLDASTEVVSGDGSKTNPYKIKKLIDIKIDGTTYYAEEGMTWADWINSKYNTIGLTCRNDCSRSDDIILGNKKLEDDTNSCAYSDLSIYTGYYYTDTSCIT